jgi:hypothetical protein
MKSIPASLRATSDNYFLRSTEKYLTQLLTNNSTSQTGNSGESDSENLTPHRDLWNSLWYDDFVNMPNIGSPILTKSNSATSNLILALGGQVPFDGLLFERMPADGPPFLTDDRIAPIAGMDRRWMDRRRFSVTSAHG